MEKIITFLFQRRFYNNIRKRKIIIVIKTLKKEFYIRIVKINSLLYLKFIKFYSFNLLNITFKTRYYNI